MSRSRTRIYVGRIASRTRTRDLDYLFSKYGRIRDLSLKSDYGFVEYDDSRDASDAVHYLDGHDLDGSRLIVQMAKSRGPGGDRDGKSKGFERNTKCFNCGKTGHWASDCKDKNWSNLCYRCGKPGHILRECKNTPRRSYSGEREKTYGVVGGSGSGKRKSYSRSRSKSKGRSRSRSRDRSRSGSRSDSRSRSRSRSPARKSRSRSPSKSRRDRSRSRSATPDKDRNRDDKNDEKSSSDDAAKDSSAQADASASATNTNDSA